MQAAPKRSRNDAPSVKPAPDVAAAGTSRSQAGASNAMPQVSVADASKENKDHQEGVVAITGELRCKHTAHPLRCWHPFRRPQPLLQRLFLLCILLQPLLPLR
jgi:hypothetical protein